MAIGTRQIVIAFVLIATFAFALISFGINIQNEWTGSSNLLQDSRINNLYTGVNSTLKTANTQANGSAGTLYGEAEETKATFFERVILGPMKSIAQGFTNTASSLFNVLTAPLVRGLNLPQGLANFFGAVLATIFGIVTVFLAWRLFKQGA
tara:strand:+ start:144 stop:596 length:453 start_codon:yes stop_codon:yes gene_type:complete